MAQVKFYTFLREKLGVDSLDIKIDGSVKLKDFLRRVEGEVGKEFLDEIVSNENTLALLNGRNIHQLKGWDTIIKDEDKVDIFPAAGGG